MTNIVKQAITDADKESRKNDNACYTLRLLTVAGVEFHVAAFSEANVYQLINPKDENEKIYIAPEHVVSIIIVW